MRILIAPDKFRGTLTAAQAAQAIATGWRRTDPGAEVATVPLADGGEGTLDALLAALDGERFSATVTGPLGDPVDAQYGLVRSGPGLMGVVEMSRASGLALLSAPRRNPRRATSRGTGELILHACRRGASRVLVCIGGSATNDGGAGMAQALGVRLLSDRGVELAPGGEALLRLSRVDMTELDPAVRSAEFVAASDVDNPLVGPSGASAVYGPQKGASPEDVVLLDRALGHFAAVIHRDLGIDVREIRGAGAAGGMGAGLVAFLGARLRPGVELVMEAVNLRERIAAADLVVTGEGAFDQQSLHGKAPEGVLRTARELGVPAIVLCGQARVDVPGIRIASLAGRFGLEAATERSRPLLEALAAEVAADYRQDSGLASSPS